MKKKVPFVLREPNLVPKNLKIRLFLFLLVNGILLALFPILAIFINFPYGYLCWILIVCIAILFNIKAYHIHTERYPLNDYLEYQFNPLKDEIKKIDGEFVIDVLKISNNVYKILLKNKVLYFDLKGCICPLTVIRAYLIRQFTIRYINQYKLVSDTMGKNINIFKLFKECENVILYYKKESKDKKFYIIKSYRTKMNSFIKSINGYGYVFWYVSYHGMNKYYMKVSENDFVDRKNTSPTRVGVY